MKTLLTTVCSALGMLLITSCGERAQSSSPLESTSSSTDARQMIALALEKLDPYMRGQSNLSYTSVHFLSGRQCPGFWAQDILGLPTAGLASPSLGVMMGFSDRAELAAFAKTAILFGDKMAVKDDAGQTHRVTVCAEFAKPFIPLPSVSGNNQN